MLRFGRSSPELAGPSTGMYTEGRLLRQGLAIAEGVAEEELGVEEGTPLADTREGVDTAVGAAAAAAAEVDAISGMSTLPDTCSGWLCR